MRASEEKKRARGCESASVVDMLKMRRASEHHSATDNVDTPPKLRDAARRELVGDIELCVAAIAFDVGAFCIEMQGQMHIEHLTPSRHTGRAAN